MNLTVDSLQGKLVVRAITPADDAFATVRAWGIETRGDAGDPLNLGLYAMLCAFHNDIPVGCAALAKDDLANRPALTPWLANVFVLPAYRQHGVATDVINGVIAEAVCQGFDSIWLYHEHPHTSYSRMGWKFVESVMTGHGPVAVMKRDLARKA